MIFLACVAACVWGLTLLAWDLIKGGTRRSDRIAIAIDQVGNANLGGWPDETISARAHRLNDEPGWRRWEVRINRLFGDKKHCEHAYLSEKTRRQTASEYRK